ncbi:MAG: chorismate mutase [Candidatus Bathyarchaeota archaeon]|nr:chorismate mutase [Candidatus Bathyarchaeum tardum]WGM88951.1 MAG: chorismate mutase [Candidatus Bathyarchaeum tardum]WNZ28812.1 MAG: chorismate mutase [Candidatus Bathyarchaeota archaeon]
MTLRKKIDLIDEKLILLLKERMDLCKSIGVIKAQNGLAVKDHLREDEVYLHVMSKALEAGLDPQKVEAIFKDIVALSVFVQGAE